MATAGGVRALINLCYIFNIVSPKDQHNFFIKQDCIQLHLYQKFDVGRRVVWYWNLDKKLWKQQKNVQNYEKCQFHLNS